MAVHVGTAIEQTINIYSTAGVLADPTTLTVYLRHEASGTQTSYVYGVDSEITRTSAGVYVFHSPALDRTGTWWVGWVGTGTGVTVTDDESVEVCGLHVSLAIP